MAAMLPPHHSRVGFLPFCHPCENDPKNSKIKPQKQAMIVMVPMAPQQFAAMVPIATKPHQQIAAMAMVPIATKPHQQFAAMVPKPQQQITVENVSIIPIQTDYHIAGMHGPIQTVILGVRHDNMCVALGGRIDTNETEAEAMNRECMEESFGSLYLGNATLQKCPRHIKRSHAVSMIRFTGPFTTKAFLENKKRYGKGSPAEFNEINALVRFNLDQFITLYQTNPKVQHVQMQTVDGHTMIVCKWAIDSIFRCLRNNFHMICPEIKLKEYQYNGSKRWLQGARHFKI